MGERMAAELTPPPCPFCRETMRALTVNNTAMVTCTNREHCVAEVQVVAPRWSNDKLTAIRLARDALNPKGSAVIASVEVQLAPGPAEKIILTQNNRILELERQIQELNNY